MQEVVLGLVVTAFSGIFTVAERSRVQGWTDSVRTANEHSFRVGRTSKSG